jgi:hypothetical protein
MMRVFSGVESLGDAMARGAVTIDGPPRLARAFGTWFLWSPFHDTVSRVAAERA